VWLNCSGVRTIASDMVDIVSVAHVVKNVGQKVSEDGSL